MSEEGHLSTLSSAYSSTAGEPSNPKRGPPWANRKHLKSRVEARKPPVLVRTTSEAKSATSTWPDRSQPPPTSRSLRGAFRGEKSNRGFQTNDIPARPTSKARHNSGNPFAERQGRFGSNFLVSIGRGARRANSECRNKFGSNSSIASDCSTLSVQPRVSRNRFNESGAIYGPGFGRGIPSARGFRRGAPSLGDVGRGASFAGDSKKGASFARGSDGAPSARGFSRGAPFTKGSEKGASFTRGSGKGAPSARGKAGSSNESKTGHRATSILQSAEYSSNRSLEYLDNLLQKEVYEIVQEVTTDESPFHVHLQKSPLESDLLALILKIVAKVCESDFKGNCSVLLEKLCEFPFFDNLSNYLGQVAVGTEPQVMEKLPKSELCTFFSSLLDAWPTLALKKDLRTLLTKTKVAINNISFILDVPVDACTLSELQRLIGIFNERKKMLEEEQAAEKRILAKVEEKTYHAPPDDFRHLSLHPTAEDLFGTRSGFIIRPNKIRGAYENVEHYLDVQFRLLREDFIFSLRSGIQKYRASESESRKKFKFDSIRVYPETRLESWKQRTSSTKEVGIRLNFDPHGRFSSACDWAQNKRFMHGSLLVLTADNFETFTCATVMERDVATLKKGCVLVALVNESSDFHRIFANSFTMVESEVFFEPYYLILQVLKQLDDQSFPMTDYIVKGQSVTKCPVYPEKDIVQSLYYYRFLKDRHGTKKVKVSFWELVWNDDKKDYKYVPFEPAVNDSCQLDEYQKEAYEAGMKRDFCVIQGPPGTGKTFLGLKLVESILSECHTNGNKLPILVVCLTNHALDQFLERMLDFTPKIVRVGGQSKNENLSSRNLRSLRTVFFWMLRLKDPDFESMTSSIWREITQLGESIENLQKMKKYIETPVGILSTKLLKLVVEPNFNSVVKNDETLLQWLLEDNECEASPQDYFVNFVNLFENAMPLNGNSEPQKAEKGHFKENLEPKKAVQAEKNTSFNLKSICEVKCLESYSITIDGLEEKLRCTKKQFDALVEDEDLLLETKQYDSNAIYFEKNYLKNQIKFLTRRYNKLKANLETFVENPEEKVLSALHLDPKKLLSKSRWLIYWTWLSRVQKKLLLELKHTEISHQSRVIQHEEYKMFEDLRVMKQADVVGMTTSGAARLSKLLGLLKPAIVIVEEAAEVLEAHIVASLTKSCQHLILIGDHKQLRPSTAVYELSKYCNIDVSLFERMVNNGMHCPMLRVQHRMRPEISALITPLIYPDLENHESVTFLEPVEGVEKNLFFLDHNMPESVTFDDTSKENVHEAEFVVKLAKYFVQTGYNPENITVLTFYTGQMLRIRNLMKPDDYLRGVQCVVVDKYQGEENCIVILSLVRSNENGNIGFLSIENRVCVALSRAKNGFFMIGNMECLAQTRLWQKLETILKKNDAIGDKLPLLCNRHNKITLVSKAEDFRLVSNGGCGAVCNLTMECGHICKRRCHPVYGNHKSINCEKPCARLCPQNHACKKLCKEECGDCVELVEKLLPCQHIVGVQCHVLEDPYFCTELVEDVLLSCGHLFKRQCDQIVEDVRCTKPCCKILKCGHACPRSCHKNDPTHAKIQCRKKCGKFYEGCKKGHPCTKYCYEKCGRCPFEENVNLPCGHELTLPCSTNLSLVQCRNSCPKTCPQCNLKCKKKCWENCHPCFNKVKKVIPTCGHEIDVDCSVEPDQRFCQQDCKSMAPCGHKCQLKCGQVCNSRGCKEWVTSTATKPLCGHEKVYVLCGEKDEVLLEEPKSFLAHCQEPCDTILECGDKCSGTCGQCLQGRLHQTCPKMCGRTFICGHKCNSPCQKLCPPCNEPCSFQCSHSKCNEKCGIPCSPCNEPCEWKCKHTRCGRKCSDICNRQPCNKPCDLKLPCGHDCIGFCGEPCPPQCRFCDSENTDPEFKFENKPNARYVLMVDCDHVIESQVLDQYFAPTFKDGEIVLRGCPRCGTPITKTLRYMNFVKRTYRQIAEVKTKNFGDVRSVDLKQMFLDWRKFPSECSDVLSDFCKFCVKNLPDPSEKHLIFSLETLSNYIYLFRVCRAWISLVRGFEEVPMSYECFDDHVLPYLNEFIRRLEITFNVNRQLMMDLNWELRRYHLMVDFQFLYADSQIRFPRKDTETPKIRAEVEQILFGFAKFSQDDENQVKKLFEKLKTSVVISSGSSEQKKKLTMKKKVPNIFDDLKAGSWFQCLDGHYYCVEQEKNSRDCPVCVKKGTLATNQSGRRRRRGRRKN